MASTSTDPWSTSGSYGDSLNSSSPWLYPTDMGKAAWAGTDANGRQQMQDYYLNSITNMTGTKGRDTLGSGEQGFKDANDAMQPYADYFSKLAGGDRSEALSAMAPQIDPITQQFDSIKQMFSETGARGGGSTSTMAQAPYQETAQISGLLSKARSDAATQGSGLALARGGQAQTQEQLGRGLTQDALQGLLGMRGQNVNVYGIDKNASVQTQRNRAQTGDALISALI